MILFFLILITSTVSATVGCVSNEDLTKIYTIPSGGSGNYKNESPISSNIALGCFWVQTTTPCEITGGGPPRPGFLGNTTTPQECDLDTNALILIFGSVGFGAFMLRKKRDVNFIFGSK